MKEQNKYNKQDALDFIDFLDDHLHRVKIEFETYVTDNMPDKMTWLFVAGKYDKFMCSVTNHFLEYHYYKIAFKRLFELEMEKLPLYLNTTKDELKEEIGSPVLNEDSLKHCTWIMPELVKWRIKKGK